MHRYKSVDRPNLTAVSTTNTASFSGANRRFWKFYNCGGCGGIVTAYSEADGGFVMETVPALTDVDESLPETAATQLPSSVTIGTPRQWLTAMA